LRFILLRLHSSLVIGLIARQRVIRDRHEIDAATPHDLRPAGYHGVCPIYPVSGYSGRIPAARPAKFRTVRLFFQQWISPDVGAIAQARNGDLWLASQTGLLSSTACISAVFSLLALGICAAI
jgi:hypothetical protein